MPYRLPEINYYQTQNSNKPTTGPWTNPKKSGQEIQLLHKNTKDHKENMHNERMLVNEALPYWRWVALWKSRSAF